jgi:hypothetical protein
MSLKGITSQHRSAPSPKFMKTGKIYWKKCHSAVISTDVIKEPTTYITALGIHTTVSSP